MGRRSRLDREVAPRYNLSPLPPVQPIHWRVEVVSGGLEFYEADTEIGCVGGLAAVGMGGATPRTSRRVSRSQIRNNPSRGLSTSRSALWTRGNMFAVNANDNLRKANSDSNRFWLLDRPSRDSPYPITR